LVIKKKSITMHSNMNIKRWGCWFKSSGLSYHVEWQTFNNVSKV